jgi:negative regulator of flagellin synthesis FlgM
MTDPISSFRRVAQMDTPSRQASAKVQERAPETSAQTLAKAPVARSDEVKLSEVAQKAMQEPEFDRAKVEAIKTAIQQGQYPIDSRRIAESFLAIEKMIKD